MKYMIHLKKNEGEVLLINKTLKMILNILNRIHTDFILLSISASGVSVSQILITSFLNTSCHSGFIASKNIAHVNKLEVVSWPAKKNVLHSSMISSIVMLRFLWDPSNSFWLAIIMIPSRSFP